jgi:predicted DNA-binding protein with PD1-like motif
MVKGGRQTIGRRDMRSKLLDESNGQKIFAVILQAGDEVKDALIHFAKAEHITAASFTAIGAFERATVGWFDIQHKKYRPISVDEQVEMLSCIGDFSVTPDGEPQLHAHIVVGRSDGTTRGGHLLEAHVRPTFEAIVSESPAYLRRSFDPSSGLSLIDPSL